MENRPGGGGSVGVASVVKAPPDGYTLLLSSSSMSAAVILHKSLPYDAVRDLAPVALFGGEPSMLLAAPGKNYSTVDDLVAAAKANPGKLKFASVGIGSASHLAGERFRLVAGLDVQHVPYGGPVEALNDLAAGRIDFYFVPIVPALPLAAQGKAIPLAVSTTIRWPPLPDLPTLAEMGYPISTFLTWCGLSAPAKTPRAIIDKLNDAIGSVLDLPAIKFKFSASALSRSRWTRSNTENFLPTTSPRRSSSARKRIFNRWIKEPGPRFPCGVPRADTLAVQTVNLLLVRRPRAPACRRSPCCSWLRPGGAP